jgi:hypothetical protein
MSPRVLSSLPVGLAGACAGPAEAGQGRAGTARPPSRPGFPAGAAPPQPCGAAAGKGGVPRGRGAETQRGKRCCPPLRPPRVPHACVAV